MTHSGVVSSPHEGVERDNLVVLHGQVHVLLALLVRNLHEEATDERLTDVQVHFLATEVNTPTFL